LHSLNPGMILYAGLAFVITLIITPQVAQFMKSHNITGADVHKPIALDIPEMGGVSYVLSLTIVLGMAFILLGSPDYEAVTCVLLLSAALGAYDDLKGISQVKKLALSMGLGVPLLFFVTDTTVDLVVVTVDFSWVYYILVVLGVSACSNATNILAGFNGEEAGMGAIAAFSLAVCCLILGRGPSQLVLGSLCFSLLAFLIFNKYPAHIFPGDTGTLPIGAVIAASVILGKIEFLGILALLPAITEFFLKLPMRFTGKSYGPTTVVKGQLHPPPYLSVANVLTRTFPLTEKTLVTMLWILGGTCGLISVLVALLMR
jgi:UDP-N-acetylglucosamine--dolichyl-phosphate N-acetylglucosaminephosphotransferase